MILLSIEEGPTQNTRAENKKLRPEAGPDWLMCSLSARQRLKGATLHCNAIRGLESETWLQSKLTCHAKPRIGHGTLYNKRSATF